MQPGPVFQGCSAQVAAGSVCEVLGPGGCGKSALLKLILAFETGLWCDT
ncbi:MAG: ATP-binding cassette domain-containing protein [Deltaproteobacteria bacterium]|nr:ATP-binding cassette domain-containing protein [Deltaproteobacteria bacterium]